MAAPSRVTVTKMNAALQEVAMQNLSTSPLAGLSTDALTELAEQIKRNPRLNQEPVARIEAIIRSRMN